MNTFDGVTIEDINNCQEEDFGSGISTQLLYAPAIFFASIKIPDEDLGFEECITITADDLVFKDQLTWSLIDILIDENELKNLSDGVNQRKKDKSELNFFLQGFKKKNVGFLKKIKNEPMIFGITDLEGTLWIFGNLRNRAFIETYEGTTGKKYEDNSGFAVKISSKSPLITIKN